MGVGADLYMCDVVVKSSRSLSHLLMSSCLVIIVIIFIIITGIIVDVVAAAADATVLVNFLPLPLNGHCAALKIITIVFISKLHQYTFVACMQLYIRRLQAQAHDDVCKNNEK